MERSPEITELAKALVAFQLKAKTIVYDADNPYFKSKYATLAALVRETKAELANCGLAVSQLVEGEGGITTILMHTSGQFLSSTVTLKPVKDDPQGRGSAITYSRRYAYAAILGLVSDEDDDGNHATGLNSKKEIKKEEKKPEEKPKSMLEHTNELAIKVFGDLDKFKLWRIDNNMPEDLSKLSDLDCAKVFHLIKQHALKKGIKI